MKLILNYKTILLFFVSALMVGGCGNDDSTQSISNEEFTNSPLFTLLSSQQTGVNFQNTLTEGLNTNILMYEYFYNGGGVASGDLNGDGLVDLYFTSNMAENKLYLNKGNMQFEDITQSSQAGGRTGPWKTGVTLADVNGDTKLDIYVSYSGALPEPKRANQLFINQGNDENNTPVFKDEAKKYGLASTAFSNQAYFFDFDRDGDLDMLLLNHNPKSLPVLNEVSTAQLLRQDDPMRGVRLFKQTNQVFADITTKAGIIGSGLSYGLGIGITDVNNDGWPDFYISNDYTVPDYLYINNKNGTFTNKLNESIGHNSHFSMGNDVADINNDGWQDIITLDMLPEDNYRQKLLLSPDNYGKFNLNVRSGFHYQYMRNMFQLNNGDGTFSEIGQLAGISNTDWSWAALLADYNNDGWKDLFVSNGYYRDYTNLDFIKYMNDFTQAKGRLQREDVLEIINHMPASDVKNYIFSNEQGLKFANKTKEWGFSQPANSNGAVYADLDNDGDLDLVVNNINKSAFIYQNETPVGDAHYLTIKLKGEGKNTKGIGARVTLINQGKQQRLEQYNSRGYLSSVSFKLHFGLGNETSIDSLIVKWPTGKQEILVNIPADQELVLEEKNASKTQAKSFSKKALFTQISSPINYSNPPTGVNDFDRQLLLINGLSNTGPCMIKGDLNGDGREDVFIGGAENQSAKIFIQQTNGKLTSPQIPAFEEDQASEDVEALIFDANGDSHNDIYVVSGGYHTFRSNDKDLQDRLYLNDGKGDFTKSTEALPEMRTSGSVAIAEDFNQDGHIDLFVGGRVIPGRYPESPESYILINDGAGKFSDQTEKYSSELKNIGMVTDAAIADLDQDGQNELIIVGEWMPISVYGIGNGKLENKTEAILGNSYQGWWNTVEIADINNDQKPDLLVGNVGTNTQFEINDSKPGELYFSDFDNNGSVDPIFCYYIQGKSYPYLTRDELLRQLAKYRSRYNTYESFAGVTISDIFTPKELDNATKKTVNYMKTAFFLSSPSGKMIVAELPIQAQYAPVYTINVQDVDQDGKPDVLLCGNNSNAKLRLGKFDANYGVLLKGNGQGQFEYIDQMTSGFKLKGDVRCVLEWEDTLIFGINGGETVAYKKN